MMRWRLTFVGLRKIVHDMAELKSRFFAVFWLPQSTP
jgi:hypothetical protein